MARESTEQRLVRVHAEAMREFDNIQGALRDERLQCLQDRRFYSIAGAQWEGPLGAQFENKPKMEVNKIALAVQRIFSEYRANRVTVDFVSKEGKEYDPLAETCDDLYRADEQDSGADEAYDNAFQEAVGGGFGAYRLRTVYENEEDDEDERQRIKIEPIFDADSSVFFDLQAKRQDKADAKRCFVLTSMTPDSYREAYNDDPASWPKEIHQYEFDWSTPDVIYVAEYYRVEMVSETVRIFQSLDGEEERYRDSELDDEMLAQLEAIGSVEVRQKRIKRQRVRKYILSGAKVLEDAGYIAGKHIPIVPTYGRRWFIDNIERCAGHVRLAKDAQRLANMQRSKLAEIAALSSVEKPILVPEQVAGHQVMWSEDNLKDYPYLLLNPITGADGSQQAAGPVGYTKSPQIPPAMAALLQISEQDIRDVLGNQEQGDKIVANVSGKAVEMVQQRLDMQTFIYMSNHAVGVRRGGEIWLSMAREIYVEPGRKMKGIGSQGQMSTIELMRPVMSEDGEVEHENDLSEAEFDLAVEVGPSSSSKRAATVRSLTAMMAVTQDPDALRVLQAAALMNMEGEGLTEISDHFRRQLVQMGVIKPTDEEAAQMAQAGANPDPNAIFLQAAAEEAQAKAAKARADVVATVADAELTQAKTMETLAKVGGEVEGAMMQPQPAPAPEPAAPQMDPFEAAKRELELENMRMDNAAKFAALAKALKQQQAEEESGSEEESSADESDDKVSETLDELKSMVESLARQVADMRPQQPIIVSTGGGGKKIQITKTSTGFSGEVVNED
jgi:hypothetical protein